MILKVNFKKGKICGVMKINPEIEISKKSAGVKALEYVPDGVVLGLGTGSTVNYFLEGLAEKIKKERLELVGIPSSRATENLARKLGIPVTNFNEHPSIDLVIDGADQIDSEFNLIKGGKGAHTMEKAIASASKEFIIIADYRKMEGKLSLPVPVEIFPGCIKFVENELRKLGGIPKLRGDFRTETNNLIIDAGFDIKNPRELEEVINLIPCVIENGIFSKRRPELIIIGDKEEVEIMRR
jgi:ribose 5-phosphate isomerase A